MEVGLYQKALDQEGVDYLLPNQDQENIIQDLIYQAIKSKNFNYPQEAIQGVFQDLQDQGADSFILGCTELPLAKKSFIGSKFVSIQP
ncbi:Asp/Glu/Hydantoin racemase domain protein [Peptoniphilus sp. oral taxon 375 str. F0436]|nr:Asp/Glu/Hydantoin racemase domain protein [Peptoniphilus sp. oral taxon 375 str. F0436]